MHTKMPRQLRPDDLSVECGDYVLLGKASQGTFSESYRARYATPFEFNPELMIKLLQPALARDPSLVNQFRRNGTLALLLNHPNVIETYALESIAGRSFLVTPYIPGIDLALLLHRLQLQDTRLRPVHASYIAARIATALHYAHSLADPEGSRLGILHRRVTPSNIRLSVAGEIKLRNFTASSTVEAHEVTAELGYMSPEQLRGLPLDARSDVYSLGIILHEMLSNRPTFQAANAQELFQQIHNGNIVPPSFFNRRVSPQLDELCSNMYARDASDRYPNAAAAVLALEGLVALERLETDKVIDALRRMCVIETGHVEALQQSTC